MVEFTLSRSIDISLAGFAHPTVTADFDGDGRIEIVPSQFTFPGGVFLPLQILEFQDDGSVVDIAPELFGGDVPGMDFGRKALVADLNGDGFDDLIIADHGFDQSPFPGATNIVALSDGKGGLRDIGARFETEPQFTHSAAVGDFDGDGRQDIFWGNLGVDDAFISSISKSGAVQRIGVPIDQGVNAFTWSHAADLDGDGADELILGADNNIDPQQRSLVVDFGTGAPVPQNLPRFNALATFNDASGVIVIDIETTDLNGDGLEDILLLGTGADPFYVGFSIQALEQTASGGFVDRSEKYFDGADFERAVVEGSPLTIELADLDVDGDLDILLTGFFPNDLTIFERVGSKFVGGERFGDFSAAVTADVDGDFAPEIITVGQFTLNVYDSGLSGSPTTDGGVPIDGFIFEGGDAPDEISGGAMNDSLVGGGGNDALEGLGGRDLLIGGGGGDTLTGGGGKDTLEGGGGKDLLLGGGGRDELRGGGGRDTLQGGGGRDLLEGGGGRDELDGGGGKDTLAGGGGRDTIEGGRGADILSGGGGRDVFLFGRGDGADVIEDWRDRQDLMQFENASGFGDVRISQAGDDALIRVGAVQVRVEGADADAFTAADFLF